MLNMFKAMNANKAKLREYDPATVQRIKEGAFLVRFISESQVAARKCGYYAGICTDEEVKRTFLDEVESLKKTNHIFQQYYESMTEE